MGEVKIREAKANFSKLCQNYLLEQRTVEYSQLPPRRTPLGPALSVRLREMSVL